MTHPKPSGPPAISIIIPTLNEAARIATTMKSAQACTGVEIIVADGGSSDGTGKLAKGLGARLLTITGGRAKQVNRGAMAASSDVLLFLHGDTCLPGGFDKHVLNLLTMPGTVLELLRWVSMAQRLGCGLLKSLQTSDPGFFRCLMATRQYS